MRRRFGNTAIDIAAHLLRARMRELSEALAEKARDLLPGLTVESKKDGVVLSGRGLKSRMLRDATLRRPSDWLKRGLRK